MEVDWRSLLSEVRVDWRDRGSNCTKGNVNIPCPWCGNDPSYHLGISERKEAYYCYREPNRHSGRSFISLLVRLGNSRTEAALLLNKYMQRAVTAPEPETRRGISANQITRAWDRFVPATESSKAFAYLNWRGFVDPMRTIRARDLRVAAEGEWVNRLLIPYRAANNNVLTWTGRAFREQTTPRYLTQPATMSGMIYTPNYDKENKRALVITEGPFDALKLAEACHRSPYIVTALTGKQLNAAKLLRLRELALGLDSVLVALDADVTSSSAYGLISELAAACRTRYIARVRLPPGAKDPAELAVGEVIPWLTECESRTNSQNPRQG